MNNGLTVFDYEDVQLVPRKCVITSRSQADTSVQFGPMTFKIPVVPANMQTVIDEPLAMHLAEKGFFYVMHRFEPETRYDFVVKMHQAGLFASISIGVKADEHALIERFAAEGIVPEYITIDIAHGHSETVMDMIKFIKARLPETFLIAGNVATPEGVRDLEDAGADATKVGVGPGKACITKLKTGFGTGGWQLAALRLCAKAARKPIVTDGGIRYNGDIAKSIRFGADMVMIGSLFAGHEETPGEKFEIDGEMFKTYFGSASQFQKGEYSHVEGKKLFVPYRGSIDNTLQEMHEDLQSAISYAGGRVLKDLHQVDYVIVKNSIVNGDTY
ncbi:GMP reductase [Periweissella fabalis]|uniref:GMP reductase n=1 Tax=Periweissella fabalis TaxID=1070421 RepID=A0A7X6N4H4_9LACO|nr:GMP reductase [Periweissella fabalis]MCM0599461.1 GMP reductase [Periweissella fabalis]NKZ23740.1 GMP reductase [Periweissella fabalis]